VQWKERIEIKGAFLLLIGLFCLYLVDSDIGIVAAQSLLSLELSVSDFQLFRRQHIVPAYKTTIHCCQVRLWCLSLLFRHVDSWPYMPGLWFARLAL
jgi:hypothetical protein